MQNHLSDYQKAALQIMGIPVWTLKADNATVAEHSSQWLMDNRDFINDLEYAIGLLLGDNGKSVDFQWLVADSLAVSLAEKTITAPTSIATMTGKQKSALWYQLQESIIDAN